MLDGMSSILEPGRLGGVAEVAGVLGVSRQQVANLRQRANFPAPAAVISMGEVWDLDVIRHWASSDLRRAPGRPSPDAAALAVGRRFILAREIGRGGSFAVVHQALDLMAPPGTQVAVKVLPDDLGLDADTIVRFQRELETMSQLSHPNVMPVLASGTDDNIGLWYAMPLAVASLFDDLRGRAMTETDIIAVMRDICAGLDHIHRNGILHRDLKPPNVMRTPTGRWAITDFGLARDVAESSRLTETDRGMGTVFFTAPEQWIDAKNVTAAADIYSAGKVLQALLLGSVPVDDDIPPGKLAPVVRHAIANDPGRRYQDAAALLASIENAVAPASRWETAAERGKRLRQSLAVGLDADAVREMIKWADEADSSQVGDFALALSAAREVLVREWWKADRFSFARVFKVFARALDLGYPWEDCDPLADFAELAVLMTQDPDILREAICGLAKLGNHHNRWHVRDVAVGILQRIRDNDKAASALEGLQIAGPTATDWTVGQAVLGTLHPILRTGIPPITQPPAER